MSDDYNRLFVQPAAAALVAALLEASGNTDASPNDDRWRPLLNEIAENVEGRSQLEHGSPAYSGRRFVCAAWWTDHLGRKLVRVTGGHTDHGTSLHHSGLDSDLRPAVWHIGPERIYRVRRPGEKPVWLACCACGEVGRPEDLAWTGQSCGPCHDRREEGGTSPGQGRAALLREGSAEIYDLAYAPDGERLAVSSAGRCVSIHDLRDGGRVEVFGPVDDQTNDDEELRPLTFFPDGEWLVVADAVEDFVRLWRLGPGTPQEAEPLDAPLTSHGEAGTRGVALAFSPSGQHLAACFSNRAMTLWRLAGTEWTVAHQADGVTALAFSPGGKTLALGKVQGRVTFLDLGSAEAQAQAQVELSVGREQDEVAFLHFVTDKQLVLVSDPSEGWLDLSRCALQLWDLPGQRRVATREMVLPSVMAASPGGRHLAWVIYNEQCSPAEVHFWDVSAWRDLGTLEWRPESAVRALDFSPDGQELASGADDGTVKLWPWRRLLGLEE